MKVELLRTPPISGSIEERSFSPSARLNAWVRFDDEQGDEWVGVFGGHGFGAGSAVVPFGDDGGRTVLVLSGGTGYILDVAQRRLVRGPDWMSASTALTIPRQPFVAVANDTEAWFAYRDHDRRVWRADSVWPEPGAKPPFYRLALDGIRFDGVRAGKLQGKVWQMECAYHEGACVNERRCVVETPQTPPEQNVAIHKTRFAAPFSASEMTQKGDTP